MPTWITPRRLGATAVLYSVFVGGWFLGQPLPYVGCDNPEPPANVAEGPDRIKEPGELYDGFAWTASQVVTTKVVDTSVIVGCDWEPRPRLLAWVIGDWR
ncbi:hypothetical protein ACFVUB_19120 [Streptomyces niveus]|uniref:hypothetical protein n=1 Tax=Streptomyces niveus TaxID=193462 RepID=UPI0036D86FF9